MTSPLQQMLFGDIIAAREAYDRLLSPARRYPTADTTGGPVRSTRGDAGEGPVLGSAAAPATAARESAEVFSGTSGAGATVGPRRGVGMPSPGAGHDPERPGGGGWPPGPPPHPRPQGFPPGFFRIRWRGNGRAVCVHPRLVGPNPS